ncbi:hypothetical protein ACFSTC_28330 [Nonomuraea ferruginea]
MIGDNVLAATGGRTYAQVSAELMAAPGGDDELAALRQTAFTGQMLRASLLNAYQAWQVTTLVIGLGALLTATGAALLTASIALAPPEPWSNLLDHRPHLHHHRPHRGHTPRRRHRGGHTPRRRHRARRDYGPRRDHGSGRSHRSHRDCGPGGDCGPGRDYGPRRDRGPGRGHKPRRGHRPRSDGAAVAACAS